MPINSGKSKLAKMVPDTFQDVDIERPPSLEQLRQQAVKTREATDWLRFNVLWMKWFVHYVKPKHVVCVHHPDLAALLEADWFAVMRLEKPLITEDKPSDLTISNWEACSAWDPMEFPTVETLTNMATHTVENYEEFL